MSVDDEIRELRSKRLAYLKAIQLNEGFEAGILRLLTELYPDNAHFIYELLQNAEDARASHARFSLYRECLVFEHDGSRMFSVADVESITSIGNSTKADSPTDIGKFGVGFKAVFAYTQRPEIYSGECQFRIHDLVVPELLGDSQLRDGFRTKFIFPFDHHIKTSSEATSEISKALRGLGDATLLFLSNISRISYALPDGAEGHLERFLPSDLQHENSTGEQIEIRVRTPDKGPFTSHWLRYSRDVTVEEDSKNKRCTVALAFGLGHMAEGARTRSRWNLVPVQGKVSIYFPAEKETSNLRFHIHAPFASTVARDSIRDLKGNRRLLAALAELTADAMADIRDRDLLTVSALEVLPLEDDNLNTFYEPIRKQLVRAFGREDLVPTRVGSHRSSKNLVRGPADITALFSDEDLSEFTGKTLTPPLWCANAPQANQRADKFLESLSIEKWGWKELAGAMNQYYSREVSTRRNAWLAAKPDSWLQKFYALLHDAQVQHRHCMYFGSPDCRIVRVQDGVDERMVPPSGAFFPESDADLGKADVLWVKKETYSSGRSESQRNKAKTFLEHAGVKVFDEKQALVRLLDTYNNDLSWRDDSLHIKHIKRLVRFLKKRPHDNDILSGKAFLRGTQVFDGSESLLKPYQLLLDKPYEETGLAALARNAQTSSYHVLWDGYARAGLKGDFVDFVKDVGVQAGLAIVKGQIEKNLKWSEIGKDWIFMGAKTTNSAIENDWTIPGIERFMKSPSLESSRLIWQALIHADATVAEARYRPNRQYDTRQADSQLVHYLKNNAWIPDRDGIFYSPQKISRLRLRHDFPYQNQNGLLDAIGLEDDIKKQTEDYQRKDLAAREFGFQGADEAHALALAVRETGMSEADAAAVIRQNGQKPELPVEDVRNPEKRRRGVREGGANAPTSEAVRKERSSQPNIPKVIAEAKAYLRAKYTNPHGQMSCQACQREMPFKLDDGNYYFEAVQVVERLAQHFFQNRLALCPTCAAMYKFARSCSDEELTKQISSSVVAAGGAVELPIGLASESRVLRFVATHFFDLQTVLSSPTEVAGDRTDVPPSSVADLFRVRR